ncbi:MAG TPA: DUF4350 domain-containing protein [Candidatus Thermoplasmatota archaeon]|nr:DUF4350 domain-containing protein [Candidatus Thermoplasmatota archaeon]
MIFGFLKDPQKRAYTLVTILALLAVGLLAPLVWNTDGRHLTAYREGDEDASLALSSLSGSAGKVEAYLSTPYQLADIREPQRALLVVIGTERRYSEGESRAVLDFLARGGNVILADEGGYGSDIAREVGFAFMGTSLVDSRNHLDDETLVATTGALDGRDYRILFNAPTALTPLSNVGDHEVLAESSVAVYPDGSYLDVNDNGEIDVGDQASSTGEGFPLIVRTKYGAGQGTLVLVADTGLFMDAQVKLVEFENGPFIQALAGSLIPRDGTIVLDEARHSPAPLVAGYDASVRALGRATSGAVAPLVTLALVIVASLVAWWSTRETEDWTHHEHNLGVEVPVPADVRPDLERAQRMARRRISERFNIALEQVAAMTAEELARLTGDATLSQAAAGTLRSDPAPLFASFSRPSEARSE